MASELLLSEQLCDVILKVRHEGFSWRIPAHSLLLVNKSSTFKEDLEGRTEDEAPAPLTITGMQPQTAIAMLKHIYTDKCTADVTADLLIASDKFDLAELRELLEERVVSDVTLSEACQTFEELQLRQPADDECNIKEVCKGLLETHALTIFGSDLVFLLGKITLVKLLESNYLNVPDEAYVFWGIWRWGRRQSSKNDRSLKDCDVASYIDDLIVLIRRHSVQNCEGIPIGILARFNQCKTRRTRYAAPVDVLKHSSSLRACPAWEDFISQKKTDSRMLCIQLSFEKDVLLVGLTLEACESEPNCSRKGIMKTLMCVLRERDSVELRQQEFCWCRTAMRRTSLRGDPESRLETEITLLEPVFLTTGNIYSVYLLGDISMFCFPWGSIPKKRIRVDKTFVNIHGESATAVRELYLVPDVSVTWGPRGPDV